MAQVTLVGLGRALVCSRAVRGFCRGGFGMGDTYINMDWDPFDKRMALDVVEDSFTCMHTPEDVGFTRGLCGAFYMCGLLNEVEWRTFLRRIPPRRVRQG